LFNQSASIEECIYGAKHIIYVIDKYKCPTNGQLLEFLSRCVSTTTITLVVSGPYSNFMIVQQVVKEWNVTSHKVTIFNATRVALLGPTTIIEVFTYFKYSNK
jgi:hypothetical protein